DSLSVRRADGPVQRARIVRGQPARHPKGKRLCSGFFSGRRHSHDSAVWPGNIGKITECWSGAVLEGCDCEPPLHFSITPILHHASVIFLQRFHAVTALL